MSKKRFKNKSYSCAELCYQLSQLKRYYNHVKVFPIKKGVAQAHLTLKPTENSEEYTIRIRARQGSKKVAVDVIKPRITLFMHGRKTPHMYASNNLCLHFPENKEFNYTDLWGETLIPWTSLWLFYYEIWQETGEWLGGGVHGKDLEITPKKEWHE